MVHSSGFKGFYCWIEEPVLLVEIRRRKQASKHYDLFEQVRFLERIFYQAILLAFL